MKRNILFLLFLLPIMLYAQNNTETYNISGLVLDKKNNEPLAFVNIGIINKNIGTISYENGVFELEIPVQHTNEKLTFSMVGYKVLTISINEIIGKLDTFFLEESPIPIAEAKIVWNKPIRKKVGTRIHSPLITVPFGGEYAHLIEAKNYPVKVQNITAFFYTNGLDSVLIRLNFYKKMDNKPDTFPLMSYIINLKVKKGWNEISLERENIVLNEDFYIGISQLINYKPTRKRYLNYSATLLHSGHTFGRRIVFGEWVETKFGDISLFATLLYSKNKN